MDADEMLGRFERLPPEAWAVDRVEANRSCAGYPPHSKHNCDVELKAVGRRLGDRSLQAPKQRCSCCAVGTETVKCCDEGPCVLAAVCKVRHRDDTLGASANEALLCAEGSLVYWYISLDLGGTRSLLDDHVAHTLPLSGADPLGRNFS